MPGHAVSTLLPDGDAAEHAAAGVQAADSLALEKESTTSCLLPLNTGGITG